MPYALKFYLYLFVAGVVMVVVAARWLAPYGWGVNAFLVRRGLPGHRHRSAGAWKEEFVGDV
jgi:hypothetical protein